MTEQKTHVVVIGGGYAGVIAANHLRLRDRRHHPDQSAPKVRRADPAAPIRDRLRRRRRRLRDVLGEDVRLVVDGDTHRDRGAHRLLGRRAGLRLPHLRGRQHRRRPGRARRRRIRLSDIGTGAGAAVARRRWTSCTPTRRSVVVGADRPGSRRPPSWPRRAAASRWCAAEVLGPVPERPGRRVGGQADEQTRRHRRRGPGAKVTEVRRTRSCWPTAASSPAR